MDEKDRKAIAHYQAYPDEYVRRVIGVEPEPHQVKVLRAIAKPNARVCFIGANGVGKDALCAWIVEWFAYCHEGVIPTTSASDRQVGILWKEINYWTGKSRAKSAFEVIQRRMYKKSNPAAYAEGFKAASAAKMEGYHSPALLYIMTEARGVEEWGYQAMLKACTGQDNRILVQSVPGDESGEFYAIASGQRQRWEVITFPAAKKVSACRECDRQFEPGETSCPKCKATCYIPTTKLVTQESIDEKLEYGEESPWFIAPVLAEFVEAGSLALVTLGQFNRSVDRWEDMGEDPGWQDVLGVDVAWVGSNETVLLHRKGPLVKSIISYSKQRTDVTGARVREWLDAHPHGAVVIEHGIAQSGVIDYLINKGMEEGTNLFSVNVGGPAVEEEKFFDRRSELYYYFGQRFISGTIAVDPRYKASPLGAQLVTIRKVQRGDSKFQIESKRQMAARRARSPDWADAGMLTMAISDTGVMEGAIKEEEPVQSFGSYDQPDW